MTVPETSFRDELRRLQTRHPFYARPHPFWRSCFRGRLAVTDLQRWGLDVYPLIRDFARLYAHVAAKSPSESALTFLAETVFEETGSGVEADSHPTLFRNFLETLGVARHEIPDAAATDAGRECWKFCWQTAQHGTFLEGLTLVGIGIERPLPKFFQMLACTLNQQYKLDASALKFFHVHTVADVKHSQLAARIVSDLARTSAGQAQVRSVLFRLWDLQKQQLDEVWQSSPVTATARTKQAPLRKQNGADLRPRRYSNTP